MGAVRIYSFPGRQGHRERRVVEPELDMHRPRPGSSRAVRLVELFWRLIVSSSSLTEAPKRSVGRELEEDWPVSER